MGEPAKEGNKIGEALPEKRLQGTSNNVLKLVFNE